MNKTKPGSTALNDDERWAAVLDRDQTADDTFVYAVRSTGIYCRPSCASRRARRDQVSFHASCAEAEASGFRPCKRCQPNGPALEQLHAAAVSKACRLIQTSEGALSLGALAKAVGMSPFYFHRVFTRAVGLTPKAFADAQRAGRLREKLPASGSITQAIYEAGYQSNSRFYAKSGQMLGMRPQRYRAGGAGVTIRFAVGECSLGSILVAASDKGVCAIFLGDDPEGLVKELQDRFFRAEIIGGEHGFDHLVAQVVGMVDHARPGIDLPLDIRGSVFQQRVWQALRDIPKGQTATYAEIAARIGMPKAVRAVAGACAANPVAILIPCHRVLRTDGSLSGYRWGVERKRALLQSEGVVRTR